MSAKTKPAVQARAEPDNAKPHSNNKPKLVHPQPWRAESEPLGESADDDAIGVDGFKPLLPAGIWLPAKYTGHATALMFKGQAKLFLHFEVVEGPFTGVRLPRPFRVVIPRGSRPGDGGRFKLHAGGDLYALLVRLLQVKQRTDRITLRPLRHMLFRVRTRTVERNRYQQAHEEFLRYTVLDEIENAL